jgi:hypothetical protein
MTLFKHVDQLKWNDPRVRWDGHSTEEKYQRLELLVSDMETAFGMLGWRPPAGGWKRRVPIW